jgi:hypothetical protein
MLKETLAVFESMTDPDNGLYLLGYGALSFG